MLRIMSFSGFAKMTLRAKLPAKFAGTVLCALDSNPGPGLGPGVIEFSQPIRDPENPRELGTLATAIPIDMILPCERLDTSLGSDGCPVVLNREKDLIRHHPLRTLIRQRTSKLLGPQGWRLDPAVFPDGSGAVFAVGLPLAAGEESR